MKRIFIGIAEVPTFTLLMVGLGLVAVSHWALRKLGAWYPNQ